MGLCRGGVDSWGRCVLQLVCGVAASEGVGCRRGVSCCLWASRLVDAVNTLNIRIVCSAAACCLSTGSRGRSSSRRQQQQQHSRPAPGDHQLG